MLVLSRKVEQKIIIGEDIEVTVLRIRGDKVRLGITAPLEVPVHREEVCQRIAEETAQPQADESGRRNCASARNVGSFVQNKHAPRAHGPAEGEPQTNRPAVAVAGVSDS